MSTKVQNPILTGFHPDPSIVCVGDDYYIANSTFEWFPGVRIHHSRDMVNWKFAAAPLNEAHLDMRGNPASGGIWAPCLSYSDGLFYLVFTDVKVWDNDSPFKDAHNYLTTAPNITGPWSDPVYLNSSGFDCSLFHDDDGKKWYLNMLWDHRKDGTDRFGGIVMQEYDPQRQTLIGKRELIYEGSPIGLSEGPHLYKRNGYYYLLLAEGGTSYEHACTIVRSKSIHGPYELPENYPLITANNRNTRLKKSGHGSLIKDAFGSWYLAYLCGRPLPGTNRCVLGRETAISEVIWENDWPVLKNGGNAPDDFYTSPYNAEQIEQPEIHYTFDNARWKDDFQTLRAPMKDDVYYVEDGLLHIRGRESILSLHEQSLLAKRQQDFCFTAETKLTFAPENFHHMAGMTYRYNESNQYYFYLTYDELLQANTLNLISVDKRVFSSSNQPPVAIDSNEVYLRLVVKFAVGQFYYSECGETWITFGDPIDASILSDDYVQPMGFTGAFVGMCCQDLDNQTAAARFHYFKYTKLPNSTNAQSS